jgi:DNA-binding FrmR family transcriptional regulator
VKPDQQSEIIQHLRSASGHLNAVIEMAESGKPCEQVLHQLNAIQSALGAISLQVLICQVQQSGILILNSASSQKRANELKRLQSLYAIHRHKISLQAR